jgi:hypothetical protein
MTHRLVKSGRPPGRAAVGVGLAAALFGAVLLPGTIFLATTMAQEVPKGAVRDAPAVSPNLPASMPAKPDDAEEQDLFPGSSAVPARLPVPSVRQQQEAARLISELHGTDLAKAKTPAQKSALAGQIMNEALAEKNLMAGKYVSFKTALDLCTGAGDLAGAEKVVDEMDRCFAVDTPAMRVDAMKAAFKSLGRGSDRTAFVARALLLADQAQVTDDYNAAKVPCELCKSVAAGNPPLKLQVDAYFERLEQREAAFVQISAEIPTLKSSPPDAKANADVGRFRCFFKNDWETGEPMLAMGNDARLKELALGEQKLNDAAGLVKLADGWWQLAQEQTGDPRRSIMAHASLEYRLALPGLAGLTHEKAEKRIKDSEAEPVISLTPAGLPFRARSMEYACTKDQPVSRIMDAGDGLCVLGYVSGHMEGYGEVQSVSIGEGNQWVADCHGFTEHMDPHFIAYKTKPYRESVQASFFEWKTGQDKVRMISKDQGICLLTGISGHFVGTLENVQITCESDGYWYLSGTSGQDQLSGTAVAITFADVRRVATRGKSFSWKAGGDRVRVMKDGEGICGLVDVGGRFGAEGNQVGLRLDSDGYWYLQGKANYPMLQAKAAVFKYPAE